MHKIDGKPRVVEYFSKCTSPPESRYHSYELETLAVYNAVKSFRHYLHGRKFAIFTDCNSLKASRTKVELTPRVYRWWAYLQSFDFTVEYRKENRMAHASFLSRNPIVTECEATNRVPEVRIDPTEVTNNWLVAEQQRDSCVREIIVQLNDGELQECLAKTYELRAGILYRKIQRNGTTTLSTCNPKSL